MTKSSEYQLNYSVVTCQQVGCGPMRNVDKAMVSVRTVTTVYVIYCAKIVHNKETAIYANTTAQN